MRTFYLEYHDAAENKHKFWRGIHKGRFFLGHWGRVDTEGQTKLWTHHSSNAAAVAWQEKYDQKIEAGYREARDLMSEEELAQRLKAKLAEEPYELYWESEPGHPIVPEHLMQAASEAEKALGQLGHPRETLLRYMPDGQGHVRIENDMDVVCFGYPPPEAIANWTADGRKPPATFKSRDGWLGSDGTGRGVIVTYRRWIDLPARIFLARLKAAAGLRVTDTFDEGIGTVPSLPDLGLPFDWEDYADELDAIAARLDWIPGLVKQTDGLEVEIDGQSLTLVSW